MICAVNALRKAYLGETLRSAALELVRRGAIGVAVRVETPDDESPLIVAVGSCDRQASSPLEGTELFAIASQSKMFAAAAVLLLGARGAIELSDPISKYVPDVPAVDPDATIDQFLNHTSGIGNFIHALSLLPFPWPRFSYEDLMALARIQGRQFRAGARFDYNNTDVVVLSRLVERVSGENFGDFLVRHIFQPLAMMNTFIADPDRDFPRDRMARGYYLPNRGYDGPPIDVAMLPDYSIASAAGNVVASLEDLCKWGKALLGSGNDTGLSLKLFIEDGAQARSEGFHWFFPHLYARGVESWCWGGRSFWGHRGSFFGYHSGTFVEPMSGAVISMAMTMVTQGGFMSFIDIQGLEYMSFLQSCCHGALAAIESP